MPFPNNMFVYRRKLDMTQGALGEMCGVTQVRICGIESEKDTTPPPRLLKKIARALKFPGRPEDLQKEYTGTDESGSEDAG